jgi:hypothetical protein
MPSPFCPILHTLFHDHLHQLSIKEIAKLHPQNAYHEAATAYLMWATPYMLHDDTL